VKKASVNLRRRAIRVASEEEAIDLGVTLGLASIRGRRCPPPYTFQHDGMYRYVEKNGEPFALKISHQPIVPIRRYIDTDDSRIVYIELTWRFQQRWVSSIVLRDHAMNSRIVIDLARLGAPVSSGNARELVEWLAAAESFWDHVAPSGYIASRLGWAGRGCRVFVAGENVVQTGEHIVKLDGIDDGQRQLAGAVRSSGTWEAWNETVAKAATHPRALLAVYAALAAPLLRLLDIPPFGLDWAARSGTGKTTTAELAASVWGHPKEMRQSWGGRVAGIEASATMLCDLPLILDESTRISPSQREDVSSLLYAITNGVGISRGSVGNSRGIGLRPTARWRTVLISTGEAPITQFTNDEGVKVRVITVNGPPFPAGSKVLVDSLSAGLRENHGHAGPRLVRFLVDNPERHEGLRARHKELERQIVAKASNDMEARQATWLACLGLAQEILRDELGCQWATIEALGLALNISKGSHIDAATEALLFAYGWATQHQARFWGRTPAEKTSMNGGLLGAWREDDLGSTWKHLAFIPKVLEHELVRAGYSPTAVITVWHERGWLSGRGSRKKGLAMVGKSRMDCYRLTREAIDSALDISTVTPEG